jgi:hypothetical protein
MLRLWLSGIAVSHFSSKDRVQKTGVAVTYGCYLDSISQITDHTSSGLTDEWKWPLIMAQYKMLTLLAVFP